MSTAAQKSFHQLMPPTDGVVYGGMYEVQSAATSAVAANVGLWNTPVLPKGTVMLEVEALTSDVYVRFKATATAAATTSANGVTIPAGTSKTFWVNSHSIKYMDVLATGAGTVKWRVASPDAQET